MWNKVDDSHATGHDLTPDPKDVGRGYPRLLGGTGEPGNPFSESRLRIYYKAIAVG